MKTFHCRHAECHHHGRAEGGKEGGREEGREGGREGERREGISVKKGDGQIFARLAPCRFFPSNRPK